MTEPMREKQTFFSLFFVRHYRFVRIAGLSVFAKPAVNKHEVKEKKAV